MRSFKKLGILVAVFALCAIGAANASAAEFTASATGSITGEALETQVFTTSGGTVECDTAVTSGTISSTAATSQHVTVEYDSCSAFFFPVHISPATYNFTANGETHIEKAISITVTGGIFGECTITVPKQSVTSVDFANSGTSNVKVTPTVTGIDYTSTGGICGSSGSEGTYSGANEVSRAEGGTLRFDA